MKLWVISISLCLSVVSMAVVPAKTEEILLSHGGSFVLDTSEWEIITGKTFGRRTEFMLFHKKQKDLKGIIFAGSPQSGNSKLKEKCKGKNQIFNDSSRAVCMTELKDTLQVEFAHEVGKGKEMAHLNYIASFAIPTSKKMKDWKPIVLSFQTMMGSRP